MEGGSKSFWAVGTALHALIACGGIADTEANGGAPRLRPNPSALPALASAAPDPSFLIFLLIGQSNMEGAPPSEEQDRSENPRVKVLALRDCPLRSQVHDEWYTASPSLHTCGERLGPGDYFARW